MTCHRCVSGFLAIPDLRTGEIRGYTACPSCRPEDAALVDACRRLRELEAQIQEEDAV